MSTVLKQVVLGHLDVNPSNSLLEEVSKTDFITEP